MRSSSRADQSTPERAQSAKSQESIWVARNLGAVILQPSNRQPENWQFSTSAPSKRQPVNRQSSKSREESPSPALSSLEKVSPQYSLTAAYTSNWPFSSSSIITWRDSVASR